MTAYIEVYVDQGSDFRNVINLTDDVTNRPINVLGYSVSSNLKRSFYSANVSAEIVCSILDTSNGEIELTMPANVTSNLKAGRYVFDVKLTNSSNTVSYPLKGTIFIDSGVTI